jgi:hypothetical protein
MNPLNSMMFLFKKGWMIIKQSRIIGLLITIVLMSSLALAQDVQIVSYDTSAYPVIKVSIMYQGKSRFETEQLRLNQDNRDLPFTISESAPGSGQEKGRAVFFLVEASGNTIGKGLVDLREGVSGAFDNLDVNDLINIAWFGSKDVDSSDMKLLSSKFTLDHEKLKNQLFQITASQDSMNRSDLYKNILEALNYIGVSKEIPGNKLFVVLSTSRNNSPSATTSAECIGRAKELGIPIYSITYLSSDSAYSSGSMTRISARTGGKNVQARTQIGIINAITDFFNAPMPKASLDSKYDLMFTVRTEVNPSKAKVDLNYKGNRQIFVVQDPHSGNLLIPEDYKKYLWYSIGILGLIVVIMLMVNLFSRKTNAHDQTDDEDVSEGLAVKPAVKVSEAPKQMEKVAPVKSGPVLLLSQDGRTQSFQLNKPEITVGRHDSNDIVLPELTVTGKHAVLKNEDSVITLVDLGSTNGTFVNGERIRTAIIKPGDKIAFSKVQLTLKE